MVCSPKIEVHVCGCRFDSEGQLLECASISDVKGGPAAGANTNWKTLSEAKSENLGQGDKVRHGHSVQALCIGEKIKARLCAGILLIEVAQVLSSMCFLPWNLCY